MYCIAGVATAGIPQGFDCRRTRFIYVRSSNKDHGRGNLIEGRMPVDAKVIVIEDLISTGGSSIKAAKALEEHGAQILSLGAIFGYGLQKSINNFQKPNINYFSLSTYDVLVDVALENNIVQENDVDFLKSWRQSL